MQGNTEFQEGERRNWLVGCAHKQLRGLVVSGTWHQGGKMEMGALAKRERAQSCAVPLRELGEL